ncbi:MAG: hypothetical protein R3174_13105 [Gammaproteobacteria bacterium]|nr:hypothetical protein [Gammaproteobacteria bacterium]
MESPHPESRPPEPPSPWLLKLCHRAGIFAAVVWWMYALFATSFFSRIDGLGLFIYLIGLPVCYALAYYLIRGIAWFILAIR